MTGQADPDTRRHFRATAVGLRWVLRQRYPQRCEGPDPQLVATGYVACMRFRDDPADLVRWALMFA